MATVKFSFLHNKFVLPCEYLNLRSHERGASPLPLCYQTTNTNNYDSCKIATPFYVRNVLHKIKVVFLSLDYSLLTKPLNSSLLDLTGGLPLLVSEENPA